MDVSISGWFVVMLAVMAANLPFINERVLGVVPWRMTVKPLWVRLGELIVLYFLVGGIAYLLEARIGNTFRQGWEFYAITGCLFLVLAYPGFVFRYLRRKRD